MTFWNPIVNQPTKTKIRRAWSLSVSFFPRWDYSINCFQNMKKKFGGGEGNTPLMCLWMYSILVG
jgi:hypothetical protein